MAQAKIDIVLSNGQQAGKTINELTAQSAKLAREIKTMDTNSADFVTKSEDFKKISGRLKDVKKEAFDTGNAQNFLNSAIGDMIPITRQLPGITKNFSGMSSMIKGTTFAQKALNLAFKAFPLGLILGLLASFVQYLTGTVEGMNALRRVTMPVVQVFERLKGVLQVLGGEVFKTISDIISGKTGLWEGFGRLKDAAVSAGEGFKNSFGEGIEAGGKLAAMHQKIEEQQIKVTKRSAEIARDFKLQSEIAEDQSKSEAIRAAAAEKAMSLAEEKYRLEADLMDMKIEKMGLEHEANDTSYEQQQELADLEAQRINLETQMSEQRTAARSKLNSALNTQRAGEKAAHTEAMKEQDQRVKALEAEQKAREAFIKSSIEAEIKSNEERKQMNADLLEGFKAQQQAEFEQRIGSLVTMNQAEQDMINELFLTNQMGQQERDQMLYDTQKKGLEDRLALLLANGQQSSSAYQELFKNLLQLNFDYEQGQTAQVLAEEEKKKQIRREGFAAAAGILGGFASLLADSAKQSKKSLQIMKAAQTAEVGINTITEVSGIFASTADWGPLGWILAIGKAALATARGVSAVKKINSIDSGTGQSFADGGPVFGPSHQAGGIKFSLGGQVNEMEGNEIILTKGVYQNPQLRMIASDLNVLGGGRSFALGGPVISTRSPMADSMSINQGSVSLGASQANGSQQMALGNTEAYLKVIAEASVRTANKPILSTYQIREDMKNIDDLLNDSRN